MPVALGEKSQLVFSVTDLNRSVEFYRQLGFQLLDTPETDKSWALLTDQAILLLLNKQDEPFTGLGYMSADMPQRAAALEEKGIQFDQSETSDNGLVQATFFDPNRIGISLIRFNPSGLPDLDLNRKTSCGIFGEFYIPVKDFKSSVEFWETIGYKSITTANEPYPHGIFSDGRMIVGLHQREDIANPALSYFAPDMTQIIKRMQLEGVSFSDLEYDQDGSIRRAILTTPENRNLFLFEEASSS